MFVNGTLFVMKKLMVEVVGGLSAPVGAVADLVKADLANAVAGAYTPTVEVAGEQTTYAIQGGWWYRGEYLIEPDGHGGTRYTHRVYNVAQWMRWAVPLANKGFVGFAETTRKGIADQLTRLGERLGCETWLRP